MPAAAVFTTRGRRKAFFVLAIMKGPWIIRERERKEERKKHDEEESNSGKKREREKEEQKIT